LSDKERDCELKQIKIESLENILKKRDQPSFSSVIKDSNSTTSSKKSKTDASSKIDKERKQLVEKVKQLERERDELLDQVQSLTK
jgi:uncharacterized coiled-coil DUF342 family protein